MNDFPPNFKNEIYKFYPKGIDDPNSAEYLLSREHKKLLKFLEPTNVKRSNFDPSLVFENLKHIIPHRTGENIQIIDASNFNFLDRSFNIQFVTEIPEKKDES